LSVIWNYGTFQCTINEGWIKDNRLRWVIIDKTWELLTTSIKD
jgi:hypothetical protein